MKSMTQDMKTWYPELDLVDMAPILRQQQMNMYGADYDDEDDAEEKRKQMEEEIRKQFMQGTNDGMQRQMNQRFIDREVMRRIQEGV